MNVYLHKDNILVVETENIVMNGVLKDAPAFAPSHEPKLEDYVDLSRFADDMTK